MISEWRRGRAILRGKTAIVTGAAKGIGRAIALRFIAAGARTALADIDEIGLVKLRRRLFWARDAVLMIAADVTQVADVESLIETVVGTWGRVDVLVNNAGGAIGAVGLDATEAEWDATISLSLKSQFLCCRAVAPVMRAQGSGRIINISSNAGRYRSNTGVSSLAYSAAKAGSLQLTRSAAHELGPFGITVNAIAPGSVLSEMGRREAEELSAATRERVVRETPLAYFAHPHEIASIALFLASDDSSYVAGTTIIANGGWCMS